MNTRAIKVGLCLLWLAGSRVSFSQTNELEQKLKNLHYQQGNITLLDGVASLHLPPGFRYLDPHDANLIIVDAWHNPPEVGNTLGLIVPPGEKMPYGWAIRIEYSQDGYVKDEDADQINYDDLLKQMQEAVQKESKERQSRGYSPYELMGWARRPHYDHATHRLYWAKELHFETDQENTINYDIRVLGRRGYLLVGAIAVKGELASVEAGTAEILPAVEFNDGHRYADFLPSSDKVAAYGIAALVAGKIALKVGLFKWLIGALLAAKKLVLIAFAGIAGFLRRLFRRRSAEAKQQEEMRQYAQAIEPQAQPPDATA